MTLLWKGQINLSNWIGGPGVSTFYFSQGVPPLDTAAMAQSVYDKLALLCGDIAPYGREDVIASPAREIPVIESTTGELQNVYPVPTTVEDYSYTGVSDTIPVSTMACVRLTTDRFINGRRLQGRIFFGPLAGTALGTDGNIWTTPKTGIEAAFNDQLGGLGARMAVWHRPSSPTAEDGDYGDVLFATCNRVPSNLRSRRD